MLRINLKPRSTRSLGSRPDYVLDREARELTAREGEGGITRAELRERGYRAVCKFADLHKYGYQVVAWFSPREPRETAVVYEYAPRPQHYKTEHNRRKDLPRMTAITYEEQAAAHRVMGAPVWGVQLGLFG